MIALAHSPSLPQFTAMATAADPFLVLLNYGGLGILALLFITGRVSSKPEVDYLKKQVEGRDKLIDELRIQLTDRTIPALTRVQQVIADYPRSTARGDAELARTLEDLVTRVERVLGDDR